MIPYDQIDERLSQLGKNREWLAESTPYSADYIRTVLAPNSTRRTERVMKILSDAIEREEDARKTSDQEPPPGYSAIFLNDEQLDLADRASRLIGAPSLATFCNDVIMAEARRLVALNRQGEGLKAVEAHKELTPYWIDLHGGVAAGAPIGSDVMPEPIPCQKEFSDEHYALRVFGRSMEPKIRDGSTIVVKRWGSDKGFPKKKTIVVYSDGSGATLKEFGYRKAKGDEEHDAMGNVPVLSSLNPDFQEVKPMDGGRIDAVFVESL